MEYIPINWGIVKHPMNWITIFLMVFLAFIGFDLALKLYNSEQ
jgi:hypothetical protein